MEKRITAYIRSKEDQEMISIFKKEDIQLSELILVLLRAFATGAILPDELVTFSDKNAFNLKLIALKKKRINSEGLKVI